MSEAKQENRQEPVAATPPVEIVSLSTRLKNGFLDFTGWSAGGFKTVVFYTVCFLILYAALFLALGSQLLPGGQLWTIFLIYAAAQIAGLIMVSIKFPGNIRMPALLGMLFVGILLRNLPGEPLAQLPPAWSAKIRQGCLALVFLRSGFELDIRVFKRIGPVALRLCIIPGLVEAFVSGTVSHFTFGMPLLLGYTLGFILKAVGPAIVIQTMFELHKRGLGVAKSIPSIVVAAASFDDMVAITGYSLFSSLAFAQSDTLVKDIFHGPLDLVLGTVGGLVLAVFCSLTILWDSKLKRSIITILTGLMMTYFLGYWNYTGGGALANLVLGLAVSQMWESGWPGKRFGLPLVTRESGLLFAHDAEHHVAWVWRIVAQPLLFGLIGTGINFKKITGSAIGLATATIFSGLSCRFPTTYLVTFGANLTWRERLFIAVAWSPKATVQAALGGAPLDYINANFQGRDDFAQYQTWGQDILTTSVFAIIFCAPLGIVLQSLAAERWLEQGEKNTLMRSHLNPAPEEIEAAAHAADEQEEEEPKATMEKISPAGPSREIEECELPKKEPKLPEIVPPAAFLTGSPAAAKELLALQTHEPVFAEQLANLDSLAGLAERRETGAGVAITDAEYAKRMRAAVEELRKELLRKSDLSRNDLAGSGGERETETAGKFFRALRANDAAQSSLADVHVASAS